MKEELYIINSNGERRQLDLGASSDITLKWVSNIFKDLSKLTCSYSYTFKLPMTAGNRHALELADDIRHGNGLVRKVVRAEFYINGICLCPNANLYVSEMTTTFSCVMTWKVLKAFETLKESDKKLTDLGSLGRITWGGGETYGGTDAGISNADDVVYPDYDAGVPHEEDTPPKPCVPVYRLIQMINDTFGVKFNIGTLMSAGMGMKPKGYLNNANYYGKRVYDDYISNGVIPLVDCASSDEEYKISGIYGTGNNHAMKYRSLEYTQKWDVAVGGSGSTSNPLYLLHWGVTEGEYTSLTNQDSEQLQATYMEPKIMAIGLPVLEKFNGNKYLKPVYCYQHDTGLSLFNKKKGERAEITRKQGYDVSFKWGTRTYTGVEQVVDSFTQEQGKAWTTEAKCSEDTTYYHVYSMQGGDAGSNIGIVGFFTRCAFTLKGSCVLHINKDAVDAGRVDVSGYMWICLAAKTSDSNEPEAVTEKDIDSDVGFQSTDVPSYDEATGTYVCHFDFGQTVTARKIEVDANDEEELEAYVLLPYIPDDHKKTKTVTTVDDDGTETSEEEEYLDLNEGDLYLEGLVISELAPSVEVKTLPVSMTVTESLPDISVFNFMKAMFYMNGAMPRVERDGKTISAMYYNQLRDRMNDGEALDWSDKLLSSNGDMASSTKFHNSSFARNNYFEMASSNREKTEDEIAEELDQYGDGYGTLTIEDDTLDEEASVYKSPFYPAYTQNKRYPLIKTGNTCKVWEGDKSLTDSTYPIYGIMVYRALDSSFEDVSAERPGMADIAQFHHRMDIFSPFDDNDMRKRLFGYLQSILDNYVLVKEKFLLNEIDLRDFDESMPVYLDKYNSYFAVSTIQRDKNGICTVELVKLPRVKDSLNSIDLSYEVELLSSGYVTFDAGSNDTSSVYVKSTKDDDWEKYMGRRVDFGSTGIYAVTADSTSDPVLRIYATAVGQYRFTYTDPDSGEKTSVVRSEANIYYDGSAWGSDEYKSIKSGDESWHTVKIEIPIRNQYGEIVEYRSWTSPIFVSKEEYGDADTRYSVSLGVLIYFKLNLSRTYTTNKCPIVYDIFVNNQNETWLTNGNTLTLPLDGGYVSKFACPEDFDYLSGDSYTLDCSIYNAISYTVKKLVGTETVSTAKLSVNLRTYYDDERITENTTLTFTKSEAGQYHVFKFIADIVNEEGDVVMKLRKKVYWFVSAVDKSVITDDFGDEHDGDETTKVKDVTISGDTKIGDCVEHTYTLSYSPAHADVEAASVEVTTPESTPVLNVSDISINGFTLKADSVPESDSSITITVKVMLADGTSFTKGKDISLYKMSLLLYKNRMSGTDGDFYDFDAVNGSGSFELCPVISQTGKTATTIRASSTNSSVSVECTKYNGIPVFRISVEGITSDETADITVVAEYNGVQITRTVTVIAVYIGAWNTDKLDEENVLIADCNGFFYSQSEYENSGLSLNDVEGIAVSDGTHRFVIAKEDANGTAYGFGGKSIEISGLPTDESDFDGEGNTLKIIAAITEPTAGFTESPYSAAAIANAYTFPSGEKGYLASYGEWTVVNTYLGMINKLLTAIGGEKLSKVWWVSTGCTDNLKARRVYYYSSGGYLKFQIEGRGDVLSYVRPFRNF